jgi:hypothetical protein
MLKHALRGIRGWSSLRMKEMEVTKVISMEHKKRLFRIFDPAYPWKLMIQYNLDSVDDETYIFGSWTYTVTKRYKTEQDVLADIDEIKRKQAAILKLQETLL